MARPKPILRLFLVNNYLDYLFYRVPFAFIDYGKAPWLVLLEALLIACFWAFAGAQLPRLLNRRAEKKSRLISLAGLLLAVVIGLCAAFAFPARSNDGWGEETAPWGTGSLPQARLDAPTAVFAHSMVTKGPL